MLRKITPLFTFPLTLLLFLHVTMRTEIDGGTERMTGFGFPLPWHANAEHTSMAYAVAVVPLVLDFLLYFLLCFLLVSTLVWVFERKVMSRFPAFSERLSRALTKGICVALWCLAVPCVVLAAFLASDNILLNFSSVDAYFKGSPRSYSLAFGMLPRR